MELDQIRKLYYEYRIAWYMYQNPEVPRAKAYKYARVAWRRKLKKRGIAPNTNFNNNKERG